MTAARITAANPPPDEGKDDRDISHPEETGREGSDTKEGGLTDANLARKAAQDIPTLGNGNIEE